MRHRTCLGNGQCRPAPNCQTLFDSLIVFQNRHISGALAELIRSTRAPTKDRLIGKIMGGNPAFRGTRVPVHLLAELCPRACARTRYGGEVSSARRKAEPVLPRRWKITAPFTKPAPKRCASRSRR